MIDNVREILSNSKYNDVTVDGKSLKELLAYVRIDKETGKEISYSESEGKDFYMVQRFQLLDEQYQDELNTLLFGENKTSEELSKEYLSYKERSLLEDEEDEELDA